MRHILGATAVGLLLLGGLAWLAWDAKGQTTDPNDWYEIARTVVFAFAAIGAVPAGYIAYRRQQALEDQRDQDRRNHELDRDKYDREELREEQRQVELRVADRRADDAVHRGRFIEASAQLGSDKAAIRVAGVHALAQLADDWGLSGDFRARQQCIDVLCAYMRMPWPGRYSHELDPWEDGWTDTTGDFIPDGSEIQVRETLIRIIADHLYPKRLNSWARGAFDFTGARFPAPGRFDLSGADFTGSTVRFDRARFDGGSVHFDDALFDRSTITFHRAQFTGGEVRFGHATMDSGAIHFGGAVVNDKGRIDFGGFEMRGGKVSFDQVTIFGGALVFKSTRVLGGMIYCADIHCVGAGAVILSYVTFTGDGHMELEDQRLENHIVWGRITAGGPPDLTFEPPIQSPTEVAAESPHGDV